MSLIKFMMRSVLLCMMFSGGKWQHCQLMDGRRPSPSRSWGFALDEHFVHCLETQGHSHTADYLSKEVLSVMESLTMEFGALTAKARGFAHSFGEETALAYDSYLSHTGPFSNLGSLHIGQAILWWQPKTFVGRRDPRRDTCNQPFSYTRSKLILKSGRGVHCH